MVVVHEDFDHCYRAVQARDPRFDGWFVTAVRTTGIYCRPSCPVRLPLARNVSFFPTAAAAQGAGFRACKRCRPDASPGSPEWSVRTDVVARAMRLIADGTIDREGVNGLASRLGYSTRQVERHLTAEVGAGPLALARAQRAQTARLLIETTSLPFTEVAFGAGFASIRQFNDTVRAVFDSTPTALRERAAKTRSSDRAARYTTPLDRHRAPGATSTVHASGALDLRLPFRKPFEPTSLFGHLVATAVPGCEEHRDGWYRFSMELPGGTGIAALAPHDDHVACRLLLDDVADVPTTIARCRRLLDLDSDPEAVDADLAHDPSLAPWVAKAPGRRIPRTVDEGQMALRVVLGQQVSLGAAATHARRLAERYGEKVVDPEGGLTHRFPSVQKLSEAGPEELSRHALAGPEARRRCFTDLVIALADGQVDLGPGADRERARTALTAIAGIGTWSAEMIAMRALGDPDALPTTDAGVRRGAAVVGLPSNPSMLARHGRAWRPWRSYAVQHLWAAAGGPATRWPPGPTEPCGRTTPTSTDLIGSTSDIRSTPTHQVEQGTDRPTTRQDR